MFLVMPIYALYSFFKATRPFFSGLILRESLGARKYPFFAPQLNPSLILISLSSKRENMQVMCGSVDGCACADLKTLSFTSKPQMPTEEILKHFHLDTYFEVIVGSSLDHTRDTKTAVMLEALKQLGVDSEDKKKKALMIGDRKFDILGAKECGIASLGVYYGFAPANELEENGADYIVQQVPEILETIHRLS